MVAGIQQAAIGQVTIALCLFAISMALDAVDGWLARRLNQVGTAATTPTTGALS
jgi:phosphatidylglycerophosphate synthase